ALSALILLGSSCGSKRHVVNNPDTTVVSPTTVTTPSSSRDQDVKTVKNKICSSFSPWTTMQAGGDIEIKAAGKSHSASMQMRMVKDQSIMISMRVPILGIEVVRLVVTGDTLLVVDKLHKRYLRENISLLTGDLPLNVSTLQELFLGRAFVIDKGALSTKLSDEIDVTIAKNGERNVTPKKQPKDLKYWFIFDEIGKITSTHVTPTDDSSKEYKVTYSNIKNTDAGNVASDVKVATKIKGSDVALNIDYDSFKWNKKVEIDTNVPNKYKRIEAKSLLSLLGGED
ncbi:MAG: DUF4292 domain-containing protein, partial [Muribaculaceae bacterium]|nr:DUF4292 domain-containing protein [Muribaculaceae bacterium]